MKRGLALVGLLIFMPGCGGSSAGGQTADQNPVQIVLENVRARQYVRDRLSFEFWAPRLVLEEDGAVVSAPSGVRGQIEDSAWEESRP